ncbi:hypothetical protein DH2020_004131 [Rehmannia glutinosa]|uniref:Reverse transcriptase zinc-binding domain-containing protein n=1 Tax=Rehmannia glutinosa TaxID=99300 RepID=A0ABR0XNL3_REHGL
MSANYLWGGAADRKNIHWLSWKKIARKKEQGGLGFRHLRAFNLALLAKQAWRLLTRLYSLLARLLRAKYYPNGNFLSARLGSRPSWSWRSILESRPAIFLGARRLIRSGTSTRIWLDPWIPRKSDFFAHPLGTIEDFNAIVSALIDVNNSCWCEDIIRDMFNHEEASLILSMPISACHSEDLWCWHPNKNALATVDFLANHHIVSSDNCPLCSLPEDANHIFFFCRFAKHVWQCFGISDIILRFMQSSFSSWFQDVILRSPTDVGNLFTTLSFLIWYHRNKRKFESVPMDPISVIMVAHSILRDFNLAECNPEVLPASLAHPLNPTPLENLHCICFDGVVSAYSRCCGIGVAAFNDMGHFVEGISKNVLGIVDPEVAECLALKEAIKLAEKLNIGPFSIFCDATQVILAANEQVLSSSASSGIVQDIIELKRVVPLKGIFWFRRSFNFVAHSLANYAKSMMSDLFLWDHLLEPLCQSLMDDFQQF